MKSRDWGFIRCAALKPESRPQVQALLQTAVGGRSKAEHAPALAQRSLDPTVATQAQEGERAQQVIHLRAVLADWNADIERIERTLKETAGQVLN